VPPSEEPEPTSLPHLGEDKPMRRQRLARRRQRGKNGQHPVDAQRLADRLGTLVADVVVVEVELGQHRATLDQLGQHKSLRHPEEHLPPKLS